MSKNKPLDQNGLTDAKASDHSPKVQNKFDSHACILERLVKFASSVPDFRRTGKGNIRHRLKDVLVLMIFARASRCVGRIEIIEFGRHNLKKFQKLGLLSKGVPSEPTLCRIEKGIDSSAFADKMREFVETYHKILVKPGKEIICIDGKAERGTVQENGRNPDIVGAYSYDTGIILATEACQEKSNEIKAVPKLLDKIDIAGKIITADAMSMQKDIVDKIREKGGDFLIELKANQRALRYGVEDRLRTHRPVCSLTEGPELAHGRIETRTYRIYKGSDIVVDKERWGADLTVIEYESDVIKKSSSVRTSEKRLYLSSLPPETPMLGLIVRMHWSIESMHWGLDYNLSQDKVKRKSAEAARNLDTIQRIVFSLFSIWKGLRKKKSDKSMGMAQLMRRVSKSFTKLSRFLSQI